MRSVSFRSPRLVRAGAALLALAFAVVLACVFSVSARADTTYTVRVLAGNRGLVNGEKIYTIDHQFAYGDEVNLNDYVDVTVTDPKYYHKGFRKSGEDWLANPVFTITEDTDFVVAYGVEGDMVSYTVSFVEYGTGNELKNDEGKTSVSFIGKKGDKPVVPYEYVPGYRPRYRNITGTLGADGTNNWKLEYIAIETPTTTETTTTTTTTTVTGGGTTTGGTTTGGTTEGTGGNAAGGTEGGTGGGTEGGTTQNQPTTIAPTGTTPVEAPPTEEIIDVDATPTTGPTANNQGGTGQNEGDNKPKNNAASLTKTTALVALIIGLVSGGAYVIMKRRKEEDQDDFSGPFV